MKGTVSVSETLSFVRISRKGKSVDATISEHNKILFPSARTDKGARKSA